MENSKTLFEALMLSHDSMSTIELRVLADQYKDSIFSKVDLIPATLTDDELLNFGIDVDYSIDRLLSRTTENKKLTIAPKVLFALDVSQLVCMLIYVSATYNLNKKLFISEVGSTLPNDSAISNDGVTVVIPTSSVFGNVSEESYADKIGGLLQLLRMHDVEYTTLCECLIASERDCTNFPKIVYERIKFSFTQKSDILSEIVDELGLLLKESNVSSIQLGTVLAEVYEVKSTSKFGVLSKCKGNLSEAGKLTNKCLTTDSTPEDCILFLKENFVEYNTLFDLLSVPEIPQKHIERWIISSVKLQHLSQCEIISSVCIICNTLNALSITDRIAKLKLIYKLPNLEVIEMSDNDRENVKSMLTRLVEYGVTFEDMMQILTVNVTDDELNEVFSHYTKKKDTSASLKFLYKLIKQNKFPLAEMTRLYNMVLLGKLGILIQKDVEMRMLREALIDCRLGITSILEWDISELDKVFKPKGYTGSFVKINVKRLVCFFGKECVRLQFQLDK